MLLGVVLGEKGYGISMNFSSLSHVGSSIPKQLEHGD